MNNKLKETKLKIENLKVKIDQKIILNNLNLSINQNEIHAIMGPNGVGKSTLSKVIMGDKNYEIIEGKIIYKNKEINNLETDERSRLGLFLAMQNPVAIEGVSNQDFLRTAMSYRSDKNVGLYDFIVSCENALEQLNMDSSMVHRHLNVGFSGGEKKKNEVLQIKLLKPELIILDEIDSGLDVDSLKIVCQNLNQYLKENPDTSMLIITHHCQILNLIKPDYVHILLDGEIVKTGPSSLADEIEKKGYENYKNKTNNLTGIINYE